MKKNEIINGMCSGYNHEGVGIIKVDDIHFYVREAIIDEEIAFKILKISKRHGFGKIMKVIKASPYRIKPKCQYYGKCGGCQLQHMQMEEQIRFKKNFVQDNIKKIAMSDIAVEDVIVYPFDGAYRNKAQFPVQCGSDVSIGFYRLHSNEIVDIDVCMIQSHLINDIMNTIKSILKQYSFTKDLKHILIKHAFHKNEVMVVLVSRENHSKQMTKFISELGNKYKEIQSMILNINSRNDNVILGKEEVLLFGKSTISEELMGLHFQIASKSFYQVNPYQTEQLYRKVLEYAQIGLNDTVIDLYCGVGSISLFLAQSAKKVIGIEIVQDAIINALENAKQNNIENVEFVCSDAGTYADQLVQQGTIVDVVVVDPPRKGCDQKTIDSIVKMSPKRVVYVSCNPSTLARDIKSFEADGYVCKKVQPVDMFPNTFHVETVALLQRGE